MVNYFLEHQWLQFKRSASFERELGLSIFIWIIGLLIFVSFVLVAFTLPKVVNKIPSVTDPVWFINQTLIYFFIGELFMRYFLQKVPALDIQPYLYLPIKRMQVAFFLVGKSLFSLFNILSLVLTLPFALQVLMPKFGVYGITGWLVSIFCISLCIHFFNILFKKKFEDLPLAWAILILIAAANYALSHYFQFDLFKPIIAALVSILYYPAWVVLPLFLVGGLMLVTVRFFKENLYLEEINNSNSNHVESYSEKLNFLGRSSLSNTLMLQEIKMILRHKRTRSILLLSVIFVGYGLVIFGRGGKGGGHGILLFFGLFLSGIFSINYGQFFWSWNTNQLDFFFTKPLALQTWLKSRYKVMVSACLLSTLLAVPYVYFGWEALLIIFVGSLYNIGINIPLMIRLSMWGPKPLDLDRSPFLNYQGTGAAQWLMGLPIFLGAYMIYVPINLLFGHIEGLVSVGLIGLVGIALRDYILNLIVKKLQSIKYKLIHDLTL